MSRHFCACYVPTPEERHRLRPMVENDDTTISVREAVKDSVESGQ